MSYREILYEVKDGIATIALHRPDKLNAWTEVMGEEVRGAMHAATQDQAARVIVLTGSGRGFCAGADMSLLSGIAGDGGAAPAPSSGGKHPTAPEGSTRLDFHAPFSYFPSIPKPVIAAVNGAAAGLGLVIATYCDLRFAAESAVFTTAFSRRGLIAEHGVSFMLTKLVGLHHALDLLLSGRKIDAAEALRMGLVGRVLPDALLMDGVRAYARELVDLASPRSMAVMKRQIWEAQFQTLAEATDVAAEEMRRSFASADFKEGVAHFLEKRPPAFTGR